MRQKHSIKNCIQGVWRYVVQIPYEGYFTQTVEVVKCLSTKVNFIPIIKIHCKEKSILNDKIMFI